MLFTNRWLLRSGPHPAADTCLPLQVYTTAPSQYAPPQQQYTKSPAAAVYSHLPQQYVHPAQPYGQRVTNEQQHYRLLQQQSPQYTSAPPPQQQQYTSRPQQQHTSTPPQQQYVYSRPPVQYASAQPYIQRVPPAQPTRPVQQQSSTHGHPEQRLPQFAQNQYYQIAPTVNEQARAAPPQYAAVAAPPQYAAAATVGGHYATRAHPAMNAHQVDPSLRHPCNPL